MTHPHHEHRAHKVEKRRLHLFRAAGGGIDEHADRHEKDDELGNAVKRESKKERAMDHKMHGGKVKARLDKRARGGGTGKLEPENQRIIKKITPGTPTPQMKGHGGTKSVLPKRASGGRTKHHKGKPHTTVNVMVPHAGGGAPPMMPPGGAMPPPRPPVPAAPMMGGAPQLPPSGGMPPPGMPPGAAGPPPGMMRPGMPIRSPGGRTYAKGGGVGEEGGKPKTAVKDGPAWNTGLRAGTHVQHGPGKNDQKDIRNTKPITYATGGPVEHPLKGGMAPFPGSGGGLGRLRKEHRAERSYAKAK